MEKRLKKWIFTIPLRYKKLRKPYSPSDVWGDFFSKERLFWNQIRTLSSVRSRSTAKARRRSLVRKFFMSNSFRRRLNCWSVNVVRAISFDLACTRTPERAKNDEENQERNGSQFLSLFLKIFSFFFFAYFICAEKCRIIDF